MSRLDPSIPLGIKPIQGADLLQSTSKAIQLSDMMAQRQQRLQQVELDKSKILENQQQLVEKKRNEAEDAAIKTGFDEAGGDIVMGIKRAYQINPTKAAKFQEEYDKHLKSVADQRKTEFDNHEKASDWIAQNLNTIKANPAMKPMVLQSLVSTGMFDPKDPQEAQILQQLSQYDPADENSVKMLDGLIGMNTDRKTQMLEAKQKADIEHQKEQDRLTELQRSETERHNRATEEQKPEAGFGTSKPYPPDVEKQKIRIASAEAAAKASATNTTLLSPEATEAAARQWATTGTLPNLGMGGRADRVAIMNRGSQLLKGLSLADQKAAYTAQTGALNQLTKQASAINAFENTAFKNLDQFLTTAKKVVDTGSPLINRPLRSIDEKALGSTDVAAYRAARQVALTEVAKVLNNPGSAVALSAEARKEALDLANEGSTIGQLYAVVNTLKNDMVNRRTGFDDQINSIKGAIANLNPEATKETPTAAAPATGAGKIKVRRKSDGKVGSMSESAFDPAKYEKVQ